jgi:hypothetical protein
MLRRMATCHTEINSTVGDHLSLPGAVTKYREHCYEAGIHRAYRRLKMTDMKRTPDDRAHVRAATRDAEAHNVTRLDRETLESVMRDDVFRVADGKALARDPCDLWPAGRRSGRRS